MKFAHVTSTCIRNISILIMHDYFFLGERALALRLIISHAITRDIGKSLSSNNDRARSARL